MDNLSITARRMLVRHIEKRLAAAMTDRLAVKTATPSNKRLVTWTHRAMCAHLNVHRSEFKKTGYGPTTYGYKCLDCGASITTVA